MKTSADLGLVCSLPIRKTSDSLLAQNDNREEAFKILNMFDNGVTRLIEGPGIDRPHNALMVTHNLHSFFGNFQIYFEPIHEEQNTYRINTFLPRPVLNNLLPVTRTLFLTEARVIEPPLPRLLAIHREISHILHLSTAGSYIDRILQDAAEQDVRVDGSFPLARLVQLKIEGLLDGIGV